MQFPRRWTRAVAFGLMLSGCHRAPANADSAGGATTAAAPVVLSVAPRTITMRSGEPVTLEITGTAFDVTNNTVMLGPVSLSTIASRAQGTAISFTVPDRVPGSGGAAPALWVSGAYPLTVSTARGSSAPVMITVVETR